LAEVLKSPYMEAFSKKDYEVIVLFDDIDDFLFSGFEYKGKKFKSISKGTIELDKSEEAEKEKAKKELENSLNL